MSAIATHGDSTAVARRWFQEVWQERRAETIDELLTDQSLCRSPGGELCGAAEFKARVYQPFLSAFPDLAVTVEGTVAEGNEVVVRWTARGTHTGEGLGLPPTGRAVFLRGLTWIRISGGKLLEGWDCWNFRELIESLR